MALKTSPACSSVNACQVGRYGYAASPERCHTATTSASSCSSNGRMAVLASLTAVSRLALQRSGTNLYPPINASSCLRCRELAHRRGDLCRVVVGYGARGGRLSFPLFHPSRIRRGHLRKCPSAKRNRVRGGHDRAMDSGRVCWAGDLSRRAAYSLVS